MKIAHLDRNALGQLVREAWVTCCEEARAAGQFVPPKHLIPWEDLDEETREVDRRIGETVARAILGPRRTFHAEVALMGHKDLGLCRVEETSLAGADLLRCTQLTTEPERVHWIRAASIYDLEEVSEQHARELVDQAREQAAKERAAREERARREAEAALKLRAERAGALVVVFRSGRNVAVHAYRRDELEGGVRAPELLRSWDKGIKDALEAEGVNAPDLWDARTEDDARAGIEFEGDDVDAAVRAMARVGFGRVDRGADVPDEQEEGL